MPQWYGWWPESFWISKYRFENMRDLVASKAHDRVIEVDAVLAPVTGSMVTSLSISVTGRNQESCKLSFEEQEGQHVSILCKGCTPAKIWKDNNSGQSNSIEEAYRLSTHHSYNWSIPTTAEALSVHYVRPVSMHWQVIGASRARACVYASSLVHSDVCWYHNA